MATLRVLVIGSPKKAKVFIESLCHIGTIKSVKHDGHTIVSILLDPGVDQWGAPHDTIPTQFYLVKAVADIHAPLVENMDCSVMLVGGFTKSYCVWPREEPC